MPQSSLHIKHPSQFGLNHIVHPFSCVCDNKMHKVKLDGKVTVLALAIFAGVAGASAGGFFIGAGSALLTYYLLAALYKTRTVSYINYNHQQPPGMFILRPSFFGFRDSGGHVSAVRGRRRRHESPNPQPSFSSRSPRGGPPVAIASSLSRSPRGGPVAVIAPPSSRSPRGGPAAVLAPSSLRSPGGGPVAVLAPSSSRSPRGVPASSRASAVQRQSQHGRQRAGFGN